MNALKNKETVKNYAALAKIQHEEDRLDKTLERFVATVGYTAAVETIATAVNLKAWDGRIAAKNAAWAAEQTEQGKDNNEYMPGIDSIHPAHLDQLAAYMRRMDPPEEPSEDLETIAAEQAELAAQRRAISEKVGPGAMKALHDYAGFDFEQPFTLVHHFGKFTINSIKKELPDGFALVLVHDTEAPTWRKKEWNICSIEGDNISIEHRIYKATNAREHNLSYFFSKGDFHDMRKSETAEYIIIAQAGELLHLTTRGADRTGRVKVTEARPTAYGTKGGPYTHYFDRIEATDENGRKVTIYTHHEIKEVGQAVDKSGYILTYRRADLERRAAQLRKERRAAEYQKTDDTAKVDELRASLEAKKQALVKMLSEATTADDFEKVADLIGERWSKSLYLAARRIENYAEKTAAKSYASIDEAARAYEDAKAAIA